MSDLLSTHGQSANRYNNNTPNNKPAVVVDGRCAGQRAAAAGPKTPFAARKQRREKTNRNRQKQTKNCPIVSSVRPIPSSLSSSHPLSSPLSSLLSLLIESRSGEHVRHSPPTNPANRVPERKDPLACPRPNKPHLLPDAAVPRVTRRDRREWQATAPAVGSRPITRGGKVEGGIANLRTQCGG